MLGGLIAARWGWKAAFGVVGVPGLLLALLYLKVRDYQTVALDAPRAQATQSAGGVVRFIVQALARSRTMLWACVGGAAQLVVVSAVWSWMPSFLNRVHGLPADQAAVRAALIVLCGAVGSVLWGAAADRAGQWRPAARLWLMAVLCLVTMGVLMWAFGAERLGVTLGAQAQFAWVALGGLLMTCTVGPVSVVVIDVIHPGVRATGASVLSLFQNLFGLAAGPFIAGVLADRYGLTTALTLTPVFAVVAAFAFWRASRTYASDVRALDAEPHAPAGAMPQPAQA
jgi:predicted MFS family arabinose efflux permease